jgi:2-keto-3-deoxy-L-rhamnonate aldolase RhmA
MTSKQLRAALTSGQRVFGTLIASDSPDWPEHVARMGLDFVFLDTEHIAIERKALSWMCRAYSALGLPPIVRIPSPDPQIARVALDGGAAGIMAPYVETVEQVKALVGAVKLRPLKGRRLDDALRDRATLEPAISAYLDARNADRILTINIESRPALDNLDALLAVDGLDAVLVGPHDLSVSLGCPERYDAPEFDAAVRRVLRQAREHGVGAGVFSMLGTRRVIDWSADGLNFVVHSSDYAAMRDAIEADVRIMREEMVHGINGCAPAKCSSVPATARGGV